MAGGVNSSGYPTTSQLYDPATGNWAATGSLGIARASHTATLLPDGRVLAVGGYNGSYLASGELYDPLNGAWSTPTTQTNPGVARSRHSATLLPNGMVLVAGGLNSSGYLSSAELFDYTFGLFGQGVWSNTSPLGTVRGNHTATLLPSGKVLVAAGVNSSDYLTSAELYDSPVEDWTNTNNLSETRLNHTATLLPDGKVLVAGGDHHTGQFIFNNGSAELYDPAAGTWSTTSGTGRDLHTATLLPNGKVLAAGGEIFDEHGFDGSSLSTSVNSADLYDPGSGSWSATGSLGTKRQSHTATLLPNGKVLVVGGKNKDHSTEVSLLSAELYDPASGSWTATGSLGLQRVLHTATLLPNGKVLVVGGYNSGPFDNTVTAELYDPATGNWTATGSLTHARADHTATLLPNGKVLVAGGTTGFGGPVQCELYDPAAGTWTDTGSLGAIRAGHTAILLPNGKVLVALGGPAVAELYDPATGTWANSASLSVARTSHTATLLPNRKVLAAAGQNSGNELNSAELYNNDNLDLVYLQPPVIATATTLTNGGPVVLSGSFFRGISQASGGNYQDSASNYPVVQLRSIDNSQVTFLLPDPAIGWSDTSFTSKPVSNFPIAPALVTVFANGVPSDAKYLASSTAPSITPMNVARQQGSPATNSTIATVSDQETSAGSLTVTATTVPTGLTISNIVNTNGTVTADIAASCSITTGNKIIVLQVSDGTLTTNANLTVTVSANTAPTLTYSNPASISVGGSTTVNPATASDNGTLSFALQSQGTYTGTISVNSSTGVVSISNAAPAGTHTITIRATDNCGATTDASFSLTISGPAEIAVEQPAGTNLVDGSANVSFGTVNPGSTADRVFTIKNLGGSNLTGLGITIDGTNASLFTVIASPTAPVIPGGSTTFTVRFAPTSSGAKTAALHIASNDADENPFDIGLIGSGNSAPSITPAAGLSRKQGTAASNSTIATVNDAESSPGSLVVTATTVPTGLTISNIVNTNGTITANIAASCTIATGNQTIVLQVSDGSLPTNANLVVNVTANTAPVLTYNNTSVGYTNDTIVNPATASDNGVITSFALQSQGTYTGAITVNSSTGQVVFNTAAPPGTHAITIRATDNCGATTDASFSLTVGDTAPSITASSGLSRQQGSAASTSTIATVSDAETSPGSLTVTATTVPPGLTISNIVNTNGSITADIAASCAISTGSKTIVLQVSDGVQTANANLVINVTANSAPVLTYNNSSVSLAGSGTASPATASDNGTATYALQSQGTYTGTISVNSSTGAVSLSNAGPVGTHPITVRATDNCGATTDASFSLQVINTNTAPTISPVAITRQQGTAAFSSTIATVSDAESSAGTLTVTATTVPVGITVSNIVNTNGTIKADVAASCSISTGGKTVVLQVSDGNLTTNGNLTVTVNSNPIPALTYNNPSSVALGGSTTVNTATSSDNGTQTFSVFSQGTYTGTISVNATGTVSISNAAPAGSHTITIRATDNCGATKNASFTLPVYDPSAIDSLDANITGGGYVEATALQADGKLIIAGSFDHVLGAVRNNIARLNANGTLDNTFDPNAVTGEVDCVVVQRDGKILVGGIFTDLRPNGNFFQRFRIARLNSDGSMDTGFDPEANSGVSCIALQPDGKIVIGGSFTSLAPGGVSVTRNRIARLNSDGTVDTGFNPNASSSVSSLAIQPDGKVVVAGSFTTIAATTRNFIARVNSDGTIDNTFNPNANGGVNCVALQGDGKVLLGGGFTTLQPNSTPSPTTRNRIARVNSDGTLDTGFDPNAGSGANISIYSIALQTDGKVLLGGPFTTLQPNSTPSPTTRNRIARVNSDGTLDTGFDPNANNPVNTIALQPDGKVLLGGQFTTLQPNGATVGIPRAFLARLFNDPASQSLTASDTSKALWSRGGAGPEVSQVTFETSANPNGPWTALGNGTRVGTTANWQLTGLSLSTSGYLRARGSAANGFLNGSSGVIEQVASYITSPPPLPTLSSAVSRKTHSGAGDFDINLPLGGSGIGVECRNSGGNHTLVFTLNNDVASGSATVTSGAGSVSGTPVFSGKTMTVNLTGVTNAQTITVTLSGVTDTSSQVLPDTAVNMGVLAGDTTGDGSVNSADVSQTKSKSGQNVGSSNFRNDVTVDGTLNSSDVSSVKSKSGTALP